MQAVTVHAVQPDIAWENPEANFDRIDRLLAEAPPEPDSLVVLPEMFATGFTMDARKAAAAFDAAREYACGLASSFRCAVLAGLAGPSPDEGPARNLALAVSPQRELARYAKARLFTPAGEDLHYRPGDRAEVFQWSGCAFAPLVCYDLRFPELAREAALLGAEALVYIANWPAARAGHWKTLLAARAIENQAFVIGVNRTGNSPDAAYAGGTVCFSPTGEELGCLGERPGALRLRLDIDSLRRWRDEFPALADFVRSRGGQALAHGAGCQGERPPGNDQSPLIP